MKKKRDRCDKGYPEDRILCWKPDPNYVAPDTSANGPWTSTRFLVDPSLVKELPKDPVNITDSDDFVRHFLTMEEAIAEDEKYKEMEANIERDPKYRKFMHSIFKRLIENKNRDKRSDEDSIHI